MTLGMTLIRLRNERGWTQGKLAAISRVSQSHISKIENEEYADISARVVSQLAQALEVSTDYLCEEAKWLLARPHPKELASAEYQLIETVRLIARPSLRQKVLEQLTWIAEAVLNAEKGQQLKDLTKLAANGREKYDEEG